MVAFRLETPSRPSLEGYCKVCFPLFLFVRYMLCYNICPTCHGYSLTSVSTPPTILIRLLACPQVQMLPLEIGLAVGGAMIVATHMIKFY